MKNAIEESRLSLSAVKHAKFASHETYCYTAKLAIDGIVVAMVENDGQGGSTNVFQYGLPVAAKAKADALLAKLKVARVDDIKVRVACSCPSSSHPCCLCKGTKFYETDIGSGSDHAMTEHLRVSDRTKMFAKLKRLGSTLALVTETPTTTSFRHWRIVPVNDAAIKRVKDDLTKRGEDITGEWVTL